ncbi:hypothetical protein ACKWRH_07425 [Bradyrhizobium sp. Pa8]|uniref:hypothetical protein n=1 Tax=Bradyrhizobium sp. Pa8 TaxID=3386552 RepID=UPI00403F52A9
MAFSQCMWGEESVALLFIFVSIFFAGFGFAYAALEARFRHPDRYVLDVTPSVRSPDACDRDADG